MGPIQRRVAAVRAARAESAATFVAPSRSVVVEEHPVGRTVRSYADIAADYDPHPVQTARMSPFTRRALSGSLPTHRDLPEEGGAL